MNAESEAFLSFEVCNKIGRSEISTLRVSDLVSFKEDGKILKLSSDIFPPLLTKGIFNLKTKL